MPILYSVVFRGTTVLAKYASCDGNFAEVTAEFMVKTPAYDNKLTFPHGNYLIHYICENRFIYMCITDDKFERARAFLLLNEIKRRFLETIENVIAHAVMNSDFSKVLAAEMKHVLESREIDKVNGQLDELKNRNEGTALPAPEIGEPAIRPEEHNVSLRKPSISSEIDLDEFLTDPRLAEDILLERPPGWQPARRPRARRRVKFDKKISIDDWHSPERLSHILQPRLDPDEMLPRPRQQGFFSRIPDAWGKNDRNY
ncbi:vesicle-associated membrane protein 7-like [Ctenocephalides felis]|uniref:vesicle-associated membrane protein 7-like n=1 Tax=Ctenocephalides felis TaxID=7515 RepID=UPI000E6E36C2|nr:vesicle-associated membrane protein 7-like [Ctenocephalides felis]